MKTLHFFLLTVFGLTTLLFLNTTFAEDVHMPDAVLAAAVREALDLAPDAPITQEAMLGLTELNYTGTDTEKIADLTGLEDTTNLLDLAPDAPITSEAMLGLTRLAYTSSDEKIADLTGLEYATNLTKLVLRRNLFNDITPLGNLTNLTILWLGHNQVGDITPLENLTNLTSLSLLDNQVGDITPLGNLTNLTKLWIWRNQVSDITPLANLTNLTGLYLSTNQVSDITPLTNLTNLTGLNLRSNQITDISPLIGLINLQWLRLAGNPIEDLSPLYVLLTLTPGLDVDIPMIDKITGPWLWMIAPTAPGQGGAASTDIDSLSVASGGAATEADVATNGAAIGERVGHYAWTPAEIADTGGNNINDVVNRISFAQGGVNDHSSYALITLEVATSQSGVIMKVGSDDSIKVWLNGEVVYTNAVNRGASDFQNTFLVDLVSGDNLLLVKVSDWIATWSMFVGIDADFSVLPPSVPDPLDVNRDGQVNVIDLVWVAISYGTRGDGLPADVNADGIVNVADFTAVVAGVEAMNPLPVEMEQKLLEAFKQVLEIEDVAGAPSGIIAYRNVATALADARSLADVDVRLGRWLPLLEGLLQLLAEGRTIPETTALLPNYPNPFNPETWLPYQLSTPAEVVLSIYSIEGRLVRTLHLGHQRAGVYQSRARAAYWDGKNAVGEPVASGVYFYTLSTASTRDSVTASNFSATRKMFIRK